MIIINRTRRAFRFGETWILPGSNAADIDAGRFPLFGDLLASGDFEAEKSPTESQVAEAVSMANTQKSVDAILAANPKRGERLKRAAKERKEYLDGFDREVEAARKGKG